MKTQTRAILASVVVIALALSAVSGVTYSWWSASENTEIEITTGYLDVDTSNFTMYDVTDKSNEVLIMESDDAPESIDLAYEISKDNPIGADSVLAPNGVDEVYEIKYTANFDANVYSKYMVGCTCTSDANGWIKVVTTTSSGAANQWQYFLGDENAQTNPNGNGRQTSVDVTITITLDDDAMPQNVSERITITNQILQTLMPYDLLVQDMINEGWDVTLNGNLDMDGTLSIPAPYDGVIDLNGFKITKNGAGRAIENFGTLVIRDSLGGGAVTTDTTVNTNDVIVNRGTITIEGGTFDSSGGNALNNFGTATVNGGTFLGEGNVDGKTVYGYSISNRDGAEMTINKATIPAGSNHGGIAASGGKITINGGSYVLGYSDSYYMFYTYDGEIVVNGGTFTKGGNDRAMFYENAEGAGSIVVNGGTFTGANAVPTAYLSDGRVVYNESGTNEYFVVNFDGITTAQELLAISAMVNAGDNLSGKTIRLAADIDMEGVEWTPIGVSEDRPFKGKFLGNGYTISNLSYSGSEYAGLFGYVSEATISDFNLVDVKISGTNYVGGAIARAYTDVTISDISVKGVISGNHYVGGIIGHTYSGIDSCTVYDSTVVSAPSIPSTGGNGYEDGDKVGGIAGWASNGTVIRCSVSDCTISAYRDVGGILGYANGENRDMHVADNQVTDSTVSIENADENMDTIDELVGRIGKTNEEFEVIQTGNVHYNVVLKHVEVPRADSSDAMNQQIADGVTEINMTSGVFIVPDSAKEKILIFNGTGDTVIATQDDGSYEGCDYSLDGATATFNNITINTDSTTYTGYARMKGTYNNCIINGTYTLYGDSVFNDCVFNVSGDVYNIWTWGAPKVIFNNCTFNSDGKAVLLYGTVDTKLTFNDCVFNDNGGLPDLKAAIEIGNDYGKSYELVVNDTVVNGYEVNDKGISTGTTLWGNKDSMGTDKLNVVVDGVDVY